MKMVSVPLLDVRTVDGAAVSAVAWSDCVLLRRPKSSVRHNLWVLALKKSLKQRWKRDNNLVHFQK